MGESQFHTNTPHTKSNKRYTFTNRALDTRRMTRDDLPMFYDIEDIMAIAMLTTTLSRLGIMKDGDDLEEWM